MPKIQIKNLDNKVIYTSSSTASFKSKAVEEAVENKVSLQGANLERANLKGANLKGANLHGANLEGANLEGANLRGASLEGASLEGASLEGASLIGVNLIGASLIGVNLYGAHLHGAHLQGASLQGANLYGASLEGANLHGASLHGASLHGARLIGVNLKWANLEGAHLQGAKFNEETNFKNCWFYYKTDEFVNSKSATKSNLELIQVGTLIKIKNDDNKENLFIIQELKKVQEHKEFREKSGFEFYVKLYNLTENKIIENCKLGRIEKKDFVNLNYHIYPIVEIDS